MINKEVIIRYRSTQQFLETILPGDIFADVILVCVVG